MRNRAIFIKLKNFVDAQGYTIEQIRNATASQIKSALNLTDGEFTKYMLYAPSIKKLLIEDLRTVADDQMVSGFRSQIHSWLSSRFPAFQIEKEFSDKSHRKVIFHLDGGIE